MWFDCWPEDRVATRAPHLGLSATARRGGTRASAQVVLVLSVVFCSSVRAAPAATPTPGQMQSWLFRGGGRLLGEFPRQRVRRGAVRIALDDDDDDDDEGQVAASPLEARAKVVRYYLTTCGFEFPEGASVKVLPGGEDLLVRHTVETLGKIENLLVQFGVLYDPRPPMVDITTVVLKAPSDVAAKWGLDGSLALDPESSPLGRAVPTLMSAEEGQRLLKALRALPQTEVVGTVRCVTLSGNTTVARQVARRQIQGEEETRDIGVVFMCTPCVAADGVTIDLELEPEVTALDRRAHEQTRDPARLETVAVVDCQTKVLVYDGSTLVLCSGVPAPIATPTPKDHDPRPVIMLMTTRLIDVDAPQAPSRRHIVIEE